MSRFFILRRARTTGVLAGVAGGGELGIVAVAGIGASTWILLSLAVLCNASESERLGRRFGRIGERYGRLPSAAACDGL